MTTGQIGAVDPADRGDRRREAPPQLRGVPPGYETENNRGPKVTEDPLRRSLILPVAVAVIFSSWVGEAIGLMPAPGAPQCGSPSSAITGGRLARGLSINVAPNPARAGDEVSIFGRLLGVARGVQPCDVRVAVFRRAAGLRRSNLVARTRTDRAGLYRIVLPAGSVTANGAWFATARGLQSSTVDEHVHALVTLASTATFMVAGDRETLSGQVIPAHRGQAVLLQRRTRARWQTIARARLDRASSFSVTHLFTTTDGAQWRAVLPESPRNIQSRSPLVKIKVAPLTGIHRIRHVVIIMQENRSFDSYFGTYPGADGIPPGICVPDPVNGGCVAPFHDPSDLNYGGPHSAPNAAADIDRGAMDGFVGQAEQGQGCSTTNPNCSPCQQSQQSTCIDVMGYHDAREIPNYWTYARDFVLQDKMFEPDSSWSLPAHLYQVSEWSAFCTNAFDPFSCRGAPQNPNPDYRQGVNGPSDETTQYAWTDITYLLHKQNVSWGYYVFRARSPTVRTTAR